MNESALLSVSDSIINDYRNNDTISSNDTVIGTPLLVETDSTPGDIAIIELFDTDTHKYITPLDSLTSETREGIYSEMRHTTPADNPWLVSLLILAFIFFAISYRRGAKYLHHIFTSLFNVKSRGNLFDETTINENQLKLSLLTLTFITEGVALYYTLIDPVLANSNHTLPFILICIAICLVYYFLQRGVYHLLGNIFGDRQQTANFLESFTSVNLFIGLFFIPFILLMLYMPELVNIGITACVIIYFFSRAIIIYKGIRFFLPHLYNLLYIILYLCAVEIIPLLLIRKWVLFIYMNYFH